MQASLDQYIRESAGQGPVYMPYLTVGDPSLDATVDLGVAMIDAGADLLELGVPFSDPTADGPVIEAAMVRAMARGFSMQAVLDVARRIHAARPETPLIFLSYLNPILNGLGERPSVDFRTPAAERTLDYRTQDYLRAFVDAAEDAGVRGVVIPDLPFDSPEGQALRELYEERRQAGGAGVAQILMIAPNTGEARLRAACKAARGFLYYVTSLGVTGMRAELPPDLRGRIELVKRESGLPVLAGFGFSQPEQARSLVGVLDGIIVGSLNHRVIAGALARAVGAPDGERLPAPDQLPQLSDAQLAELREELADITRGFKSVSGASVS